VIAGKALMASVKITKTAVDEMQAGNSDAFLWDTDLKGFGLKMTRKGARTYIYQYRMHGRGSHTRRYTIGAHGSPWTPSSARDEARRIAMLVDQGVDPGAKKKEQQRLAVDLAFTAYGQRFLATCEDGGWKRLVERTLRLHVNPHLRGTPLPEIKRSDIVAILDKIPTNQVALKRNSFAVLRRLFRWAVGRGDVARSPCEGMETPPAVDARDRVLTDHELAVVWAASKRAGRLFGPIVRLLLVTGKRREEVTQMCRFALRSDPGWA
jgi:hypothetical protein